MASVYSGCRCTGRSAQVSADATQLCRYCVSTSLVVRSSTMVRVKLDYGLAEEGARHAKNVVAAAQGS